jgi:hypothetical protein
MLNRRIVHTMKRPSPRDLSLPVLVLTLAACGDATQTSASSTAVATASAAPKPSATAAAKPSATATASAAADSAAPSASAAPAIPPPFDGKLTIAQVMYGGTQVHPFDAWDDAMKTLTPLVGKPTGTHGANSCWAAVEGDRCAYFCIEKTTFEKLRREKKGPAVGSTDNPQTFGPDGPSGNVAECHDYAGKGAAKK